jgi:hypothetical protein
MPDTDPLKTAGPLHVKVPVAPTVEFPVTLKFPLFVIPVKDCEEVKTLDVFRSVLMRLRSSCAPYGGFIKLPIV